MVALVTVVLVTAEASPPAGAGELEAFGSCEELSQWGDRAERSMLRLNGRAESSATVVEDSAGSAMAEEGGALSAAPAPTGTAAAVDSGEAGSSAGDGTNVAVDGVDELDLVDRVSADQVLVASRTRLAIVDLAAGEVVDSADVGGDAQITYDPEARTAWVVSSSPDGTGTDVARVAVADDGLAEDSRWTADGRLVDARRVGSSLHLVVTAGFPGTAQSSDDGQGPPGDEVPFADGPVPCDEVLHPTEASAANATLIVTLPVAGELTPSAAAEVVGAGEQVHVTTEAAYLATVLAGETIETSLHRFDLGDLSHTGSGRVEGGLLDQFSMSEAGGNLRVAVTMGGGFGLEGGGGMIVGDVAVEGDVVQPAPLPGTGSEPRNQVVVLDTEGDLDVVGRTERFGKPGESIHGIRFAGDTAYVVTFLQTDPFYVVDLSDPSAPAVVGEVELPGFSSYLHPVSEDLVVGFGPGADGRAAAKLFDVSDPRTPTVAGELVLGDESAVTTDHHALVDLGAGRFAVPATSWTPLPGEPCPAQGQGSAPCPGIAAGVTSEVLVVAVGDATLVEEGRLPVSTPEPAGRVIPAPDGGWALLAGTQVVLLGSDGTVRADLSLA